MDVDPADQEEYEERLNDTSTKALLYAMLGELQGIRLALQDGDVHPTPTERDETGVYECHECGDMVGEEEREQHLRRSHNAPRDVAETMAGDFFEAVELNG